MTKDNSLCVILQLEVVRFNSSLCVKSKDLAIWVDTHTCEVTIRSIFKMANQLINITHYVSVIHLV